MQFSASQIAELLQGEVEGDTQVLVNDVAKIQEGRKGTLTFLANPVYTEYLYATKASIAIVGQGFKPEKKLPDGLTLIRVEDPRSAFAHLLNLYDAARFAHHGIEQPVFVHPKATVAEDVYIGAFTYIGEGAVIEEGVKIYSGCHIGDGVRIGKGSLLHAGVKVYGQCVIGARCVLHAGAVIGADGFGYVPNAQGEREKMPQIGNVVLEDEVEVGANSTIDRATLGHTVIHRGVKLDNLIQVGHNVEIGAHTVVVAQTGIAGSTRIGSHCLIGGQVGIVGHLKIGDRVKIAAQSGIGANLPDDAIVQGSPAFAIGDYKRSYVLFRGLPGLNDRIGALEKELKELKEARLATLEDKTGKPKTSSHE